MPIAPITTATPYYVLLQSKTTIGPNLLPAKNGKSFSAIYGFSDKIPYDAYRDHSTAKLKPYPLVKGDLKNQVEAVSEEIRLIVLDANGPHDSGLTAATVQAVLIAVENRQTQLIPTHLLHWEAEANAYRVEAMEA